MSLLDSWVKCWFLTCIFQGKKSIVKWIDIHQGGEPWFFWSPYRKFSTLVLTPFSHACTQTLRWMSKVGKMRGYWLEWGQISDDQSLSPETTSHVFFHCEVVWQLRQKVMEFATWHENFTSLQELKCWLRKRQLISKMQFKVWKMVFFAHLAL